MRVYVSGPMTGLPGLNFPAFEAAATALRAKGYEVVSPHEDDKPGLEWHEYLRADLALLVTCDAIASLPGWEQSKGARLEHHVADELGLLRLDRG